MDANVTLDVVDHQSTLMHQWQWNKCNGQLFSAMKPRHHGHVRQKQAFSQALGQNRKVANPSPYHSDAISEAEEQLA